MAIPWDSIRSLLIFFGPILLPKAISYYRSFRAASRAHPVPIVPVPPRIRVALALLAFLAILYLVKTLPPFAPENLFYGTQSRLQIPVDVLFNRIAAGRPGNELTKQDEALRMRFVNLESRLLYLQYGPSVLADCPFCSSDDPKTFFHYALPQLLWPHIANLIAVALVTSPSLTGRAGSQWRPKATMAAAVITALDIYFVNSYNYQANARALRLPEIDFFFWTSRVVRLITLAAFNAALAWLLYLSSTNRAFFEPPSPVERIESTARALLLVKSKLSALGIMKNTALRDDDLRSRSHAYWTHEVRLMGEVMEEREVVEGVNDALSNRIDIGTITRDAEAYAKNVLQPLQPESESVDDS
ncbi:chorismate synthase [Fusarium albosuccineum]|uniref:Chorismate synthase n=1 Tax=Fusarium albosuccineum TaxID=1237068 RepID=A0A8H4P9S9_9HYPO|nr:chorismate synthase [Fusarium albosuccineum]